MHLRSVELNLPDPDAAAEFLSGVWGLADAEAMDGRRYVRGANPFAYLVGLTRSDERSVRCTTFVGERDEVEAIAARARSAGSPISETTSNDPGGGTGILVQLPEGEIFRFLHGVAMAAPLEGRDLPVKLTHVVMNSADPQVSADFAETVLGFKVSDRTKGMVFVRCNSSHHSTAFAGAGFTSLNHIAFEMADLDAVMRGVGRLRDVGAVPAWGPGRHGPGNNVFAYFIAPFGAVVEFSTAVEVIPETYTVGGPEDWTWPEGRIDQWGLSDKDFPALNAAESNFTHAAMPAA